MHPLQFFKRISEKPSNSAMPIRLDFRLQDNTMTGETRTAIKTLPHDEVTSHGGFCLPTIAVDKTREYNHRISPYLLVEAAATIWACLHTTATE